MVKKGSAHAQFDSDELSSLADKCCNQDPNRRVSTDFIAQFIAQKEYAAN